MEYCRHGESSASPVTSILETQTVARPRGTLYTSLVLVTLRLNAKGSEKKKSLRAVYIWQSTVYN